EKGWANMKRVLRGAAPLCDSLQTAIYDCWRQVFLPRTTIPAFLSISERFTIGFVIEFFIL
ncbi:MAG: hypothetical protein LBK73_15675, partial [Treponema sp.]|nr:hypothetical protein [Treponema sp.]